MNRDLWLALIAQEQVSLPGFDLLSDKLNRCPLELPAITQTRSTDTMHTFQLGESAIGITAIDRPIPEDQLAGPVEAAWYWPEAEETLAAQKAHLLISLVDEGRDRIAKANRLTQLVAALISASPALGVFWGPGRLIHEPGAFLKEAAADPNESLPLNLWIDFRLESAPQGGTTLYTTGMEPLGHREFEVVACPLPPGDLRNHVYNAVHYVLDRGAVLSDGEAIGFTDQCRAVVEHAPSLFDPEQDVIRLVFQPPDVEPSPE